MIVIDTHSWFWWVKEPERLSEAQIAAIQEQESNADGLIGICATSLWEIAMLVQRGRLQVDLDLADWFANALAHPRVGVINLTPAIAIASTMMPADFPRDPADRIITATARVHNCPLVTSDDAIRNHAAGVAIIY